MRIRTVLTSAAAAVMLLAPTSAAQAAAPPDRSTAAAQHSVAATTGLDTDLLAGSTTLAAGTVAPATGTDGADLPTLVHDRGTGGYSLVAVLDDGRSRADFDLDLPDGSELRPAGGGAFQVVDVATERSVGVVEAPWAVDARGTLLHTRYTLLPDGRLRQHVDTDGAVFPVAADPTIAFGFHRGIAVAYMQWSRTDTIKLAKIAGPVGAVATAICGTLQVDWRVRAACSAMVGPYAADMVSTAQTAARTPGRCFKMRVPLYPVAATIWMTYDSYHVPC